MAISDYKDEICLHCSKKGFRGRNKVQTVHKVGETIMTDIEWIWICAFCNRENIIIFERTPI